MLDSAQVANRLQRVDWNFPGSTTLEHSVHALHWFPGNFIPEIPSFLIELLSAPGQTILDPFCGSGTTGVEAVRLGRLAIMSDINSASIQVAKGKLAVIGAKERKGALLDLGHEVVWSSFSGPELEQPESPLVSWLHPNTLSQLNRIWRVIAKVQDEDVRRIAEMLFSDTLFGCASTGGMRTGSGKRRRHHWGWVADNVVPKPPIFHDALDMFRDRLEKAIAVIDNMPTRTLPDAIVRQCDARFLDVASESIDLVVTSPPYLGMIDYSLANRLSYLWFGWPMETERMHEIGARFRRRRRNIVEEYLGDMQAAMREIHRCLRVGSCCAIVIGASRSYSFVVDEVIKVASSFMPVLWGPVPRIPTRRRLSDRGGTEPREYVCVFQKSA